MLIHSIRLLILTLLSLVVSSASSAAVFDRLVPDTRQTLNTQTKAPTGRIIVKFTDESQLLVTKSGLAGGDAMTLQRVQNLVDKYSKRSGLQRHFQASMEQIDADRLAGQRRAHHVLPNLNRYGVIDLSDQAEDQDELMLVLKAMLADPAVETAFLEPKAVPAALGFDAFSGTYTVPVIPAGVLEQDLDFSSPVYGTLSGTPDFSGTQGYLGEAPEGVNALAVNDVAGAHGNGLKIIDIEGAWVWEHEDLPDPFFNPGLMHPDQSWRDHGTAVLGEIRGTDNGFGVRGIAPEVAIGGVSIRSFSVASAIDQAWRALDPGDVIVIELHAPGPNANGQGQFGYVPMEYWQDNFDAILLATANGRIVCEAAGNGSQNLDDDVYGLTFDRDFRDSGAIMCGAANRLAVPEWFTNYGSRLDLNGWGSSVTTLGYGDLQGSPNFPEVEFYTSHFSGTSSATPIVTGAVLALQGIVKAGSNTTLDPILMREILSQTGSPASGIKHIGPRPDILAAWTETQVGFGTVSGTVTDAISGLPLGGVVVHPVDANYEVLTDENGTFSLGFPAGQVSLDFSSFFHSIQTLTLEIIAGQDNPLNVALVPLPTVDIFGHVSSQNGGDLTGVRASVLDAPLIPSAISTEGDFTITGAPDGRDFRILIDGAPMHGADLVHVSPVVGSLGDQYLQIQLAEVEHPFELWWEGYQDPSGTWTWGTPVGGPAAGFSGEKCWGVGMDGNGYPDNNFSYLNSIQYNLYGEQQALLSFHYFSETEAGIDGVKLQIQVSNTWVDMVPETDYDYDHLTSLNGAPAWSGNSDGWRGAVFDLMPYIDDFINLRFFFASDLSISEGGFYIDDITFYLGNNLSPVELLPGVAAFAPRVTAVPNPFNPQTEIAWEISQPGALNIEVFDARGRRVRVLHDGTVTATRGSQLFDGRDDHGARLASGMYLVQVRDGRGLQQTTRISLVK